mmetsp:Transcript_34533/g.75582  ORF Transcript_34533/g.75582 Transcript_34533/m.75582 type:complete len:246 (+) Transcript_34533:415-1152(+)|eukprot:CAMPEP_0178499888 /NCGR_PEP_ID=MMETSP0696-20121128/16072_1 /TAXON_ID=265572 /ORGANISM="Extubocellulus spinifer, Strain CCMP396" /LENGTH=245 /DNA_ID=CAMNT_0020128631 /DNA_START=388 /DNA_END=1125 /DNA_ORIENTATION=-
MSTPRKFTPVKRPDPISADSPHDHELCLAKQKSMIQSLDESERLREEAIGELNEALQSHEETRDSIAEKDKQIEQQAKDGEAKTKEAEEIKTRLQEVEADYEEVSGKLVKAQEEIAEGSEAYEDQEKLLDGLRKDKEELTKQKEEAEHNLSVAETKIVEKSGALDEMEEEVTRLNKRLSAMAVELNTAKRVQENNQVSQDAIEIDNRKLNEELAKVKGRNGELQSQLKQAKEALEQQGGCACLVM